MGLFSRKPYVTLNTVRVLREALRHNLALYRRVFPGKAICPVLKANAYGHGLVEVAKVLEGEMGRGGNFLVVDSLYEAYALQGVGIRSPILILGYTLPENLKGRRLPFHFAVSDLESAKVLTEQGAKLHLKIDTGMNRMGFSVEELTGVLPELKGMGAKIVGVLTHLADADNEYEDSYTFLQLARFEQAVQQVHEAGFDVAWIHAGQSAGALKQRDFLAAAGGHGDFVTAIRLGIGLYGIAPVEGLKPVMQVMSTVVGVRTLAPGDRVSYGGTFTADRAMTIAAVPFGYYEGLPRALSNVGCMRIVRDDGSAAVCPIVGRVCMNYTMIDVSGVRNVKIGDSVEVYSNDPAAPNSIAALAKLANTIPYELMVRLAESVRREVV